MKTATYWIEIKNISKFCDPKFKYRQSLQHLRLLQAGKISLLVATICHKVLSYYLSENSIAESIYDGFWGRCRLPLLLDFFAVILKELKILAFFRRFTKTPLIVWTFWGGLWLSLKYFSFTNVKLSEKQFFLTVFYCHFICFSLSFL